MVPRVDDYGFVLGKSLRIIGVILLYLILLVPAFFLSFFVFVTFLEPVLGDGCASECGFGGLMLAILATPLIALVLCVSLLRQGGKILKVLRR
jgi:hypothetical protein